MKYRDKEISNDLILNRKRKPLTKGTSRAKARYVLWPFLTSSLHPPCFSVAPCSNYLFDCRLTDQYVLASLLLTSWYDLGKKSSQGLRLTLQYVLASLLLTPTGDQCRIQCVEERLFSLNSTSSEFRVLEKEIPQKEWVIFPFYSDAIFCRPYNIRR